MRIGSFSCQAYDAGFYTAHAGLAAEDDLDLVVCLGDYIYEKVFLEGPPQRSRSGGVASLSGFPSQGGASEGSGRRWWAAMAASVR